MTKNQQRFIQSLLEKKGRKEQQLFLVEGKKSLLEILNSSWEIDTLYCTAEFATQNEVVIKKSAATVIETSQDLIEKSGSLQSNNAGIAVVKIPQNNEIPIIKDEWYIALDDIRDPGNLGTIIRIADWYGIKNVICSATCADVYNPKVIAASMGSFIRIGVYYRDLAQWLKKTQLPIYGAVMEGQNIHQTVLPKSGILVMGNEANGISTEILALLTSAVTIPRFGNAESLNVAMATAILCDNIKRQQ
jgi:TrmH family RNA methyltransferase